METQESTQQGQYLWHILLGFAILICVLVPLGLLTELLFQEKVSSLFSQKTEKVADTKKDAPSPPSTNIRVVSSQPSRPVVVEKKEPVVEKREPVVEKGEPVIEKKEPAVEKKESASKLKGPMIMHEQHKEVTSNSQCGECHYAGSADAPCEYAEKNPTCTDCHAFEKTK